MCQHFHSRYWRSSSEQTDISLTYGIYNLLYIFTILQMKKLRHRTVNGAPRWHSLPQVAEPGCKLRQLGSRVCVLYYPLLLLIQPKLLLFLGHTFCSFLQNALHLLFICLEPSPPSPHKADSLTLFRFLVYLGRIVFHNHPI